MVWQGAAGDRRPYADQTGLSRSKVHRRRRASHGVAILRRPKRPALTLQPLLSTHAPLDTRARLRSPATCVDIAHSGRILTHSKVRTYCRRSSPALITTVWSNGGMVGLNIIYRVEPRYICAVQLGNAGIRDGQSGRLGSAVSAGQPWRSRLTCGSVFAKVKSFRRSTLPAGHGV